MSNSERNKSKRAAVVKVTGYLDKKIKLTFLKCWKKWWCVLEGQLLLYYKSRVEYSRLAPCRGSLNMALVLYIQSYPPHRIQIYTHSQLIVLRAKNKSKQQQWFQALSEAMPQNTRLAFDYFTLDFPSCTITKKRTIIRKNIRSNSKLNPTGESTNGRQNPLENNDSVEAENDNVAVDTTESPSISKDKSSRVKPDFDPTTSICPTSTSFRPREKSCDPDFDSNYCLQQLRSMQERESIPLKEIISVDFRQTRDDVYKITDDLHPIIDFETNKRHGGNSSLFINPAYNKLQSYTDFMFDRISEATVENNAITEDSNADDDYDDNSHPEKIMEDKKWKKVCDEDSKETKQTEQLINRLINENGVINENGNDRCEIRLNNNNNNKNAGILTDDRRIMKALATLQDDEIIVNGITSDFIKVTDIDNKDNCNNSYRRNSNGESNTDYENEQRYGHQRIRNVAVYETVTDEKIYSDQLRIENANYPLGCHNLTLPGCSHLENCADRIFHHNQQHRRRRRYCKLIRRRLAFGKRPFKFLKKLFPKRKTPTTSFVRQPSNVTIKCTKKQNIHNEQNNIVIGKQCTTAETDTLSDSKKNEPEPAIIENEANEDTEQLQTIRKEDSLEFLQDTNCDSIVPTLENCVISSLFAENPEIKEFFLNRKNVSKNVQIAFENIDRISNNDNNNSFVEITRNDHQAVHETVTNVTDPIITSDELHLENVFEVSNDFVNINNEYRRSTSNDNRQQYDRDNSQTATPICNRTRVIQQEEEVTTKVPVITNYSFYTNENNNSNSGDNPLETVFNSNVKTRARNQFEDDNDNTPEEQLSADNNRAIWHTNTNTNTTTNTNNKHNNDDTDNTIVYCSECRHKTPVIPIKQNRRLPDSKKFPQVNTSCYNSNFNLDMLLLELLIINKSNVDTTINKKVVQTEYDYDIPRPHTSLLETINKRRELDIISENSMENTDLDQCDSDLGLTASDSSQITPDSLEHPWTLYQRTNKKPITVSLNDIWNDDFESDDDVKYPDSLNSVFTLENKYI